MICSSEPLMTYSCYYTLTARMLHAAYLSCLQKKPQGCLIPSGWLTVVIYSTLDRAVLDTLLGGVSLEYTDVHLSPASEMQFSGLPWISMSSNACVNMVIILFYSWPLVKYSTSTWTLQHYIIFTIGDRSILKCVLVGGDPKGARPGHWPLTCQSLVRG